MKKAARLAAAAAVVIIPLTLLQSFADDPSQIADDQHSHRSQPTRPQTAQIAARAQRVPLLKRLPDCRLTIRREQ
jgi:hypothetical protein